MAIKTKDELMASIKAKIGDDNSDDAIALVEDISDTYDDMQSKAKGDGTDWKAKYEENDKAWRQKYTDRFFSDDEDEIPPKHDDEDSKSLTYDNLFKEE